MTDKNDYVIHYLHRRSLTVQIDAGVSTDSHKLGAAIKAALLSDADLSGSYLGLAYLRDANLSGADLSDAYLRGADLRDAYLRDANLSGADLRDANLRGANLRGADLRGAYLRDTNLSDANLSGAVMPDGLKFEEYLSDVTPALLTAGGKTIAEIVASGAWQCHSWDNCPMHAAFGIKSENDAPPLLRARVAEFVQLFDAGLIPEPKVTT